MQTEAAAPLTGRGRFLDGFENLLDDLRVQRHGREPRSADRPFGRSDGCLWIGAKQSPLISNIASASAAVRRGSLGMNFDGGGENLLAERGRALFIGERFQEQLDGLANVG